MSNICSVVMITMHILDMDTSIFKNKEGIEGKFRNAAKRDISSCFSKYIRTCLSLADDEDVEKYIKKAKRKYQKNTALLQKV